MKSVLYFSTEWCSPCKLFWPVAQEVCSAMGVSLQKVDAEQNRELALQYSITGVPAMIMLKDGVQVNRQVGVVSKSQLIDMLNRL
jgi:thioredoxin 1